MLPSEQTAQLHARLTEEARRGELVGSIVIPLYRHNHGKKQYLIALSGWAAENPTFAAGAMSVCQLLLQEKGLHDAGLL